MAQQARQLSHHRDGARIVGQFVTETKSVVAQARESIHPNNRLLQQSKTTLAKRGQRGAEISAVYAGYVVRGGRLESLGVVPVQEMAAITRHLFHARENALERLRKFSGSPIAEIVSG